MKRKFQAWILAIFFIVNVFRTTFHFGGLLFYLSLLFSPEALLKYDIHAFLAPGQQNVEPLRSTGAKENGEKNNENCSFL